MSLGDWGGIIICGQAPISTPNPDRTDIIDIFYGGSYSDDSSGVLRNLRVEYAGQTVNDNQTFDGISFYGVGAITTISEVQVYESAGNGIRFIGGNAIANSLMVSNSGNNSIVLQNNWFGSGNSWFLNETNSAGISVTGNLQEFATGIEGSITDISITSSSNSNAINFSGSAAKMTFSNIYTSGMLIGIAVSGEDAATQIELGALQINDIQFANTAPNFMITDYNGANTNFYIENQNNGAGNQNIKPDWASGWTLD